MSLFLTSLALGSLYSLIALSFIFYFSYTKFLNIAILGYIAFVPTMASSIAKEDPSILRFIFAIVIATLVIIFLSFIIDRLIFEQLNELNTASKVIASTSILFIFRALSSILWPETALLHNPIGTKSITIFSNQVLLIDIISIVGSIVLMASLWFFLRKTLLGKRVRAYSYDSAVASSYGISKTQIAIVVSIISGILCSFTGIALASPGSPRDGVISVAFFALIALAAVMIARHNDIRISILASFAIAFAQIYSASKISEINKAINSFFEKFGLETTILIGPNFANRFVPFMIAILALVLIPKSMVKEPE